MKDACDALGIKYEPFTSVDDLVGRFTEEDLNKLAKMKDLSPDKEGDSIDTGAEWANIIRSIQNDDALMQLDVVAKDSKSGVYVFQSEAAANSKDYSAETIVTFKGTVDGDEWYDNFVGLNVADTPVQKETLDFIESLPYTNMTAVGHSKGGNKAMYTALLSDKITSCYALDAPGFSEEFYEKYAGEVERNAYKIKAYAVEDDYVNILLRYPDGVEKQYIKNGKDYKGLSNHSLMAFFSYTKDANGEYTGDFVIANGQQNEGMMYLNQFMNFITNTVSDADKTDIKMYLGHMIALAMDENYTCEIDGVEYTHDDVSKLLMSDKETLAKTVAYFIKFIQVYDVEAEEVEAMLEAFGIDDVIEELAPAIRAVLPSGLKDEDVLSVIINLLMGELFDGDGDHFYKAIMLLLGKDFYNDMETTYKSLKHIDTSTANKPQTTTFIPDRDFSAKNRDKIFAVISRIDTEIFNTTVSWSKYSAEDWYDSLFIAAAMDGINAYSEKIYKINSQCKEKINTVWENVSATDNKFSEEIVSVKNNIDTYKNKILELAERLSVAY